MIDLILSKKFEPFRARFEATVKPYVGITTQLVYRSSLWQSKIAGFPYLPKDYDYPKTPEGEDLYLLVQINFAEVPPLDGFPQQGILEIFIDKGGAYGAPPLSDPTDQSYFRILYFPEPDLNPDNLITNFDFLSTIWDFETDTEFLNAALPFYLYPSYQPRREECFVLEFDLKAAPISIDDYQFKELIGSEAWDIIMDSPDEEIEFIENYYLEVKHKLGGYPSFTQLDPRDGMVQNEDPYLLLLQIDSDGNALGKIDIQWEDMGIANFFIKASDLKRLDFSSVIYNYDCC